MQRGPIEDIREAMRHPAAACLGLYMGGYVPLLSFLLMHRRASLEPWQQVLVGACLAYSASSVWVWSRTTLGSVWKATSYVVLLEGGMTVSGIPQMEWAALVLLIFVNATHTAAIVARLSARKTVGSPEGLVIPEGLPNSEVDNYSPVTVCSNFESQSGPRSNRKPSRPTAGSPRGNARSADALYMRAIAYVRSSGHCSINRLKPNLNVGWTTAQRLVKRMEEDGVVERSTRGEYLVRRSDGVADVAPALLPQGQ